MNTNTANKTKKIDKKLSIYLSTKRLALLTALASQKDKTLTESLYHLIDALEEPQISLTSVQSDIRRLEGMVKHSIKSTTSLTATLTLALDGQPDPTEPRQLTAFDAWLLSVGVSPNDTSIVAIVIPASATSNEVLFSTRSAKVADRAATTTSMKLSLAREQAGIEIFLCAQNSESKAFALTGKRVEGTDWQFKFLAPDQNGKLTRLIHTFKHPS